MTHPTPESALRLAREAFERHMRKLNATSNIARYSESSQYKMRSIEAAWQLWKAALAAADAQAAEPVARVDNVGRLIPIQHGIKTLKPRQPMYAHPEPPSAEPVEARRVTLTARQILAALEFAAPDFATEDDQLDTKVVIAWGEEGSTFDDDGNPDPAGYRAWLADYPEEGAIPLDDPAPEADGEPQTKGAV
jgi:hypothetical protein